MVRMGNITRSLPLAVLALAVAVGRVGAYAPSRTMPLTSISSRPAPSFLVLPCQHQSQSRCRRPILYSSGPDAPLSEATESTESSTESISSSNAPAPTSNAISPEGIPLSIQIALGAVAAIATFFLANLAITTVTDFVAALQDNFWGILGGIPEAMMNLLVGIFGFLKVFIPAVGKFGMSAYETYAPIVSETSQRAIEAATPVIQDTAERVADVAGPILEEATKTANEAAAPYVDQLNAAVETSIVAPIQDAKGAVETQVQDATQAVTGAVEAQVQSASKAVGDAVETQVEGASKALGDAFDAQMKKFFP